MKKNSFAALLSLSLFSLNVHAQNNVGIGYTSSTPHASAVLDVSATDKGMLLPRVSLLSLTDAVTIASPAHSLLVYNTNTGLSGGLGYYYNSGTPSLPVWSQFQINGQNIGQSATSYFTTGSTSLSSVGATANLAGFPVTVNIPANCTVIMSIYVGAQTTGTAAASYSTVDILGYVDGATLSNGFNQRLNIANSTGLSTQIRNASFSQAFTLAAGSHTFSIGASLSAGSTANVGGNNTSVLQGALTLIIIKN